MISIITSIHNQLGMNMLYFEYLEKNTFYPFQLIVIDNASTDGSGDFFESKGAVVIRNDQNYGYPHCQNQGIPHAKYDYLMFLNNDVVVSRHWDKITIERMQEHGLDVASCAGTNRLYKKKTTRVHLKKWYILKYSMLFLGGNGYANMKRMHHFFFRFNFKGFYEKFRKKYFNVVVEGIAGFNVIMTRKGLEKIGEWDPRLMSADFDVFLRTKKRALEHGDIKPIHLIAEVYLHHYLRLTLKSNYAPFADQDQLIKLDDKWTKEEIRDMMMRCNQIYFDDK